MVTSAPPDRGGPPIQNKITAIGGGSGLANALQAVRRIDPEPVAVVSVVDDGGSSGRLVAQRGGLPPGDLRKCIGALAPEGSPWAGLLEHRFQGAGSLNGHALGNLMLVALEEEAGDLSSAALRLAGLIGARGRVVPVSLDPQVLCALTPSGVVKGQEEVNYSAGIRRIWVEPEDPKAHPDAVEAIVSADLVVIGPGSLFTSVIPPLLVPGIRDALNATTARRVFVANLAPQVAETRHLDLAGHVAAFLEHGGVADVVLYDPASRLNGAAGLPVPAVAERLEDPSRPGLHDAGRLADALRAVLDPARRDASVTD
jgi:uncharacterized cofD-like protein